MKRSFLFAIPIALLIMAGFSATLIASDLPKEPENNLRELCESGRYHEAMHELPRAMKEWAEYTKKTGNTVEGAAGFERGMVMFGCAEKGDAEWGKILDDPDIPYPYKIGMIFEILEARLGKGSVYVGNDDNLIVPRKAPIDLKNRIKLP